MQCLFSLLGPLVYHLYPLSRYSLSVCLLSPRFSMLGLYECSGQAERVFGILVALLIMVIELSTPYLPPIPPPHPHAGSV